MTSFLYFICSFSGGVFILLLEIIDLKMEYGVKELFTIPSLQVHSQDKIGIIGTNGCGKSTLLDIIAGRIEPQDGYTILYHDFEYIQQLSNDYECEISSFQENKWGIVNNPQSGGEITRAKIAGAMSSKAKLLLCDEPTSNLDETSIKLLEDALVNFNGGILLVSHDRKLLNTVCNYIWEIDNGKINIYRGNYDDFKEQRNNTRKNAQKEYEKYVNKKNSLEKAAREATHKAAGMKSAPKRMGNSEARLHKMSVRQKAGEASGVAKQYKKRLDRLEVKDRPKQDIKYKMTVTNDMKKISKTAVRVEHLTFSYDDNVILNDISLYVGRGQRIAITGANGSGKSTLLNAIVNKYKGTVISPNYTVGYFCQNIHDMNEDITIFDYIMDNSNQPQHVVRTVLGHLGIKREDVYKKLKVLSGGERCKVKLCQLIVDGCSLLILDEPTNYLDIYVLEALENMLATYDGTLIVVSHDRYFIDRVTNKEMRIEKGSLIDAEKQRQMNKKNINERVLLEFRRTQLIHMKSDQISEEKKNIYETELAEITRQLEDMQ